MSKIDLNNYVCIQPYFNLEVHPFGNYVCCPDWINNNKIGNFEDNLGELWESNEIKEFKKSVVDGTFSKCNCEKCPFLNNLLSTGKTINGPVQERTIGEKMIASYANTPSLINFCFDRSCNLKCPSCRKDFIVASTEEQIVINNKIKEIEDNFGKEVKTLRLSGSADPFASVSFRKYLQNFDVTKYPKLKEIFIHTNANLWTPTMWDSMKKIHKFVKNCEISIDAATKETYETKTRIGGNWDILHQNLEFIQSLKEIESITLSFVVQHNNYKEMLDFYNHFTSIFSKKRILFQFLKINDWGSFSPEAFLNSKIWDENHSEFYKLIKEIKKINSFKNVNHNMHDILDKHDVVIKKLI
jgi:radical SAM protein with 4Fe4S-binding SPASM domain